MASVTVRALQEAYEDPLAYLPCAKVLKYEKGEVIYGPDQPSDAFYVVLSGAVKVTRITRVATEFLVDIYAADDIFGGSGLVNVATPTEKAVSFHGSTLMSWPRADVEDLIIHRPQLGLSLLQTFGKRFLGVIERAGSLSFEVIGTRLARTLLRFSERLGVAQPNGSVIMEPLTHEVLAQYVCTSRELVSTQMAAFRRQCYIEYSRSAIIVYPDRLKSWLETQGNKTQPGREPLSHPSRVNETAAI